ncbi:MAG: IPT/TIG domain-containing protein [Myxococcales bacterium]|nr:IPT/TIG domain-containing protein [Myxococcales bacterium]
MIRRPTLRWLLTNIDRPHACPGETITLTGTNFGSNGTVIFSDAAGTITQAATSWSSTSIQVVVPPTATCGPISLSIPDGYVRFCGRTFGLTRPGLSLVRFEGGSTRVTSLLINGGTGRVLPGAAVPISYSVCNATSIRLRVTIDGGATLLDITTTASSGSHTVTAPTVTTNRTLRARIDASGPCGSATEGRIAIVQQPYALTVDGLEVTQAIQYYKAAQHLTDPADRGPDNSVTLTDGKAGLVRVYLRSGGSPSFNGGRLGGCTGTLLVERRVSSVWTVVSTLTPLNAPVTAEATIAYDTERSDLARTLNFAIPAAAMTGMLRFTARISSPQDGWGTTATRAATVTIDRRRTLRVAAVAFGYNGPNTATPPVNVTFAAPTAAQITADLAWALAAFPVRATPTVRIIATQTQTQPLNGAVPAGGCDPGWNGMLSAVATARTNDGAQATWAYYGFVTAQIPMTHGNVGCSDGTVAAGLLGGGLTVAHEIGHNLGLPHAPCGRVGGANASYPLYQPYDTGTTTTDAGGATIWQDASLGEYGVDVGALALFHPSTSEDFMSYCGPQWISLFTWNFLLTAAGFNVTTVPAGAQAPAGAQRYREGAAIMSGRISDSTPMVTVLGSVGPDGKPRIDRVLRSVGRMPKAPGPRSDLVLELRTHDGDVLSRSAAFRMEGCAGSGGCGCADCGDTGEPTKTPKQPRKYRFQAVLIAPSTGDELVLLRGDDEIWRRKRGPKPNISASAKVVPGGIDISWSGTDEPVWVRGSTDGGKTWEVLAIDLRGGRYELPRCIVTADSVQLEVVADDGFEHAVAGVAGELQLGERPPVIAIVRPAAGSTLRVGQPLHLWGAVLDAGSRNASPEEAVWTIDDREVGKGDEAWAEPLEPGGHRITFALKGAESLAVDVTVVGDQVKK